MEDTKIEESLKLIEKASGGKRYVIEIKVGARLAGHLAEFLRGKKDKFLENFSREELENEIINESVEVYSYNQNMIRIASRTFRGNDQETDEKIKKEVIELAKEVFRQL